MNSIRITIIMICLISFTGSYAQNLDQNGNQVSNTIGALVVGSTESGVIHGSGLVISVSIEIRQGEGKLYADTATIQGIDWQESAKRAVYIAQKVTGADLSSRDIFISITPPSEYTNTNIGVVDGPSAGAAMTVLLISDILGLPLNDGVLITGTIKSDGTIGKVGGVVEKAEAAGKYGARIFLVPSGEGTLAGTPLTDSVGSKYRMEVLEVYDIMNALPYYIQTG